LRPFRRYKNNKFVAIHQICTPDISNNMSESVPIHPVAPRLKDGPKKPHVGPSIDDYKTLHAQSIGPGSDEYWTKVCRYTAIKQKKLMTAHL
jgi:hypothetical protein